MYDLGIWFDNELLTPVSIRRGGALESGMVFVSNIMGLSEETRAGLDVVTGMWVSPVNDPGNGELFSVLFRAGPAAKGRTILTMESRGVGASGQIPVQFLLTNYTLDFGGGLPLMMIAAVFLAVLLFVFAFIIINKKSRIRGAA
jgi:hypothetical protein